jgi:hypothetical protein
MVSTPAVRGGSHRIGGKRRDALRESGHERVQFGVGQRPVDPAVPFGFVGVEVGGTENYLHGPAPPEQPCQVWHTTGARGRTETDLELPQYGVFPRGEAHVARQRQFTAGSAAELRDRNDRQLTELVPQHANDASSGPPALAA